MKDTWIGTPLYGPVDWVHYYDMVHMVGRSTRVAGQIVEHSCNVVQSRNAIVERFLASNGDWLCWVDADQSFPPDTLDRLHETAFETGAKIMGALVHSIRDDGRTLHPTIWKHTPGDLVQLTEDPEGVVACAATGCGFVLVHRDVYVDVAATVVPPGIKTFGELEHPWFDWTPAYAGEDITFFLRAGLAGHTTWVDAGVPVAHRKTVAFR